MSNTREKGCCLWAGDRGGLGVAEWWGVALFEEGGVRLCREEELPLFASPVSAGFPSPAEEVLDRRLNLHEFLVEHPAATFFVRVDGESMIDVGIFSGDILVVDRAAPVRHGSIIVSVVDGEFTVKILHAKGTRPQLRPANCLYKPIDLGEGVDFQVWGVVRYAIHAFG